MHLWAPEKAGGGDQPVASGRGAGVRPKKASRRWLAVPGFIIDNSSKIGLRMSRPIAKRGSTTLRAKLPRLRLSRDVGAQSNDKI